jgi:hypothetical protein
MQDLKKLNLHELINAGYVANIMFILLEAGIFEDIAKKEKTVSQLSVKKI